MKKITTWAEIEIALKKITTWAEIEIALIDASAGKKPTKEWAEIRKMLVAQKCVMIELERRKLLATMAGRIAADVSTGRILEDDLIDGTASYSVKLAEAILVKAGL